jgi:hypothetical protein
MKLRRILIIFIGSLCGYMVAAQEAKVSAKLDSNTINIGDQIKLSFEVSGVENVRVIWPSIPDTLGKIEIVSRSKLDTILQGKHDIVLTQSFIVTSFDTGVHVIPAFKFLYKSTGDSGVFSNDALSLQVKGIPVDTTKEIKDIKPPIEVPFSWKEFLKDNIFYILGGILAIWAAVMAYYWWSRSKGRAVEYKAVPSRPAHEIALEKLSELEKEKLWQRGSYKEYHSRLSEIIRVYIEQRFRINALELTSEETLTSLRQMSVESIEPLRQLMTLADLVKFAKKVPQLSENEASIKNAYQFVETTTSRHEPLKNEEAGK